MVDVALAEAAVTPLGEEISQVRESGAGSAGAPAEEKVEELERKGEDRSRSRKRRRRSRSRRRTKGSRKSRSRTIRGGQTTLLVLGRGVQVGGNTGRLPLRTHLRCLSPSRGTADHPKPPRVLVDDPGWAQVCEGLVSNGICDFWEAGALHHVGGALS